MEPLAADSGQSSSDSAEAVPPLVAKSQPKDESKYSAPAPSYDIAGYCRQVGDAVGGSYVIEKGCRDQEQTALSTIRSRNIPSRIFRNCEQVGDAVGGSYVIFNGCVDQEIGAASTL